MQYLPSVIREIFFSLSVAFTHPTAGHMATLLAGALLARGKLTISNILRAAGPLATADFSTYYRVFSRAVWSPLVLGRVLARQVISRIPADQPVVAAVDDTVRRCRGKKIYAVSAHRDAVRSSHNYLVHCFGHKWVVLAILVRLPLCRRPWALPIMACLWRSEELDKAEGRRHKTVTMFARNMAACLRRDFPDRTIILLGDGGYACIHLGRFCQRHGMVLVSRLRQDAALYGPPPRKGPHDRGRPPEKGRRLRSPEEWAARHNTRWVQREVRWYNGQTRSLLLYSRTGLWYKSGEGVLPIRWVLARDPEGKLRDECFFSTDTSMDPLQIISLFVDRWPLEVTFQEARAHLAVESPEQRVAPAVTRMVPALLGLFTILTLAFLDHPQAASLLPASTPWYAKSQITFSDVRSFWRRQMWQHIIFCMSRRRTGRRKIPLPIPPRLWDLIMRMAA